MYLILNPQKLLLDMSEHIQYIRSQSNGVVVGCGKGEAEAVYLPNTDTSYALTAPGFATGHTVEEVDAVPNEVATGRYYYNGEFYTTPEMQSAHEKSQQLQAAPERVTEVEETVDSLREKNKELEMQLTDTQLALIELYECMEV